MCGDFFHILVHINIRVRGHIHWAGKLGKIMYAEYIVHGLCDILLTVQIFRRRVMDSRYGSMGIGNFRRVAYHLQWLIEAIQ